MTSNITNTNTANAIKQDPSHSINPRDLDKLADAYLKKFCGEHSIPLDRAQLPEFMNRYLEIAAKQTDAIPGALITAWLPVIAVNLGNRIFIRSNGKNHFCQIWSVLVGPSSVSRKSTCLRLASRTLLPYLNSLKKLGAQERMERELVISNATNAKMVSLLASNPIRLFEFHEFGSLLKSANHNYNAGMKENLTSLYDGDSKTICNLERTERIINPAISITGASTEGWVYSGFQNAAEQGSGFLQRFIYCVIKPDGKLICSTPNELETDFSDLYAYESIYQVFRSIPGNLQLKLSKEARNLWLCEHDRVLNSILSKDDEELLAYATRIYNNVFCSLAIILTLFPLYESIQKAVKDNSCKYYFSNLEVNELTVRQALYLCHYYLDNARPMLTIISEGGAWNNERRIIKHLAKQPDYKDTHSNIMNRLRLKSKDLNACIRNLIEQNAVVATTIQTQTAKRQTTIYTLLPTAGEMYN